MKLLQPLRCRAGHSLQTANGSSAKACHTTRALEVEGEGPQMPAVPCHPLHQRL